MTTPPVIALLDPAARRMFEPTLAKLGWDETSTVHAAGAAVVCDADPDAVCQARRHGAVLLLGMQALRACPHWIADDHGWLPLLPLRLVPEAQATRAALDGGNLGQVSGLTVISYHGHPPPRGWHDTDPRPATWFESAVWALDLIEYLAGDVVQTTEWPRRQPTGEPPLAVHHLQTGTIATVWHLPWNLGAGPAYTAAVIGDHGQALLREPFAPGGLALWHADTGHAVVPEIARPGSPASAVADSHANAGSGAPPGGELTALLHNLLALPEDPARDADSRARAVRIVRHLDRSTVTPEDLR